MQPLERPHHRLHEVDVQGLVVVVEVHPACLPGHIVAPFAGVAQHRVATEGVEFLHAHRLDLGLVGDAELAFGLEFGGQAVGVPAEAAFHPLAAHGLVTRHHVFDVAGQQMTVVRQAVGERWAVVEDELRAAGPVLDGGGKGVVGVPVAQHVLLDVRERRGAASGLTAGRHVDDGIDAAGLGCLLRGYLLLGCAALGCAVRVRHGRSPRASVGRHGDAHRRPARYHPACAGYTRRHSRTAFG